MLLFLTGRLVSSLSAFLYPGYASYKALSQRPASEEELERWLMYWSVLGCFVGVEYLAEWLVSWVPFYYTIKTLFLLYLALPQTRGSSYIYTMHLQPFFHAHETQIDAALASLKARAYAFVQERLRALWDAASSSLQPQPHAHFTPVGGQGSADAAPPPSLADPASGPAQLVSTLWRSYGPGIMASGAALLRSATAASTARPPSNLQTPPASGFRGAGQTQSVLERRRQLEAELAALSVPMPAADPSRGSSGSDLGLRERTHSNAGSASARFEEVEVPSDVEGYEVGEDEGQGQGQARAGGSWFGWSGAGGKAGGYERVKSE